MTDNAELLPCPFCGGSRIGPGYLRDGATLGCRDCSASVHAFRPNANEKNVAAWNTRAPVPESPPVVGKEPICLPPDDADIKLVLHATLPSCPCCSGTPTTFARYFEHSGIYQSYVHCSHCDVQVFVNSRDREEARKHAIARWSKRPAALSKPRVSREEQQAAFLVALAEVGIPPDVQELIVQGNPSIGVAPGALDRAITALGGAK